MKNRYSFLFFSSIFLLSVGTQLDGISRPLPQKTSIKPVPKKNNSVEEKRVIEEIKALLKNGTLPSETFNVWCDAHIPTLVKSNKQPVKNLGLTLQNLRQGNVGKISAFNVLPTFEKAVQEYDPAFRIRTLKKPLIITKGTYWYFSGKKKKNA